MPMSAGGRTTLLQNQVRGQTGGPANGRKNSFLFFPSLTGLSAKPTKKFQKILSVPCSLFVIVYRMNDPHVKSLFYRIEHSDNIDYDKAPLLELPEPKFTIHIEYESARIDMRDHYAAVQDARDVVQPFLRLWELTAALNRNPGEWQFVYDRADVIDRNPTPGEGILAGSGEITISGRDVKLRHGRASFPPPPVGVALDDAVDFMFYRYCMWREGRTTLTDAANCCLTMLEFQAGNRKTASHRYGVSSKVLNKLGILLATKGGIREARKGKATHSDFTPAERQWITKLIPILIRRAAEVAFDPAARSEITMADLPPLP
jgi:hypothetical protein